MADSAQDRASQTAPRPRTAGAPPLLLGASLMFWGWETGSLWLATMAAIAIESPRVIRSRWAFTQADLDRIWNLCVLLFFGSLVVAFANNDGVSALTSLMESQTLAARTQTLAKGTRSALLVFQWMPLTLLPIALAQAFGERARLDWSTFSWRLRRSRSPGRQTEGEPGLNVAWPYFAVCLLAASIANERSPRFAIGLSILVVGALWSQRPRRRHPVGWAVCLAMALGMAFVAQSGLRQLQSVIQRLDSVLVARFGGSGSFSDKESRTMIGTIGKLKLSSSIVLRVETDGQPPPARLREASYNLFRSPSWTVPKQQLEFHQVTAETNVTTTILMARRATRELTLSSYFSKDEPLLALPLGTVRLDELNADLETNGMGVVRLKTPMPGFARLDVSYQDERSIDSAPGPEDRDLPVSEKLVLDRLAAELGLAGMAPEDRLRAVSRFFLENFQYSTWLGSEQRAASNQTALARFLLQTRTGHCEYFATATTLLLRAANIPARYAVGFSVQERKGDHWVVRDRHAHAWCLAWVNGGWHDVDNTPGGWVGVEDARASWWDNVEDAWSNVWYYFSRWRWSNNDWKQYLIWLLAPLIGLTTWRLMARKEWRRSRRGGSAAADQFLRPGLDSEFYLIEQRLSALGLERQPGETLSAWLQRLMHDGLSHALPVQELLAMHQRLRFDPKGITPDERIQLRSQVTTWLQSELVRAQERGRVRGGRP